MFVEIHFFLNFLTFYTKKAPVPISTQTKKLQKFYKTLPPPPPITNPLPPYVFVNCTTRQLYNLLQNLV
jgi:hypothetical protein